MMDEKIIELLKLHDTELALIGATLESHAIKTHKLIDIAEKLVLLNEQNEKEKAVLRNRIDQLEKPLWLSRP
jgi:hypothetical protein